MKAKFVFDMNEPEDREEFARMNKALVMCIALSEIDNTLLRPIDRQGYHAPGSKLDAEPTETENAITAYVSGMREKFYEILNRHDINIDELIR